MDHNENQMWAIAESAASQVAAPLWGFVQSYNNVDHTARVMIKHSPDTSTLTSDLPIHMGGLRYAPVIGQMAFLVPSYQDNQALVITGFAFNDISPPPKTNSSIGGSSSLLQPGEAEIIGPNGSSFRFNMDGSGYMTFPQGLDLQADVDMSGDLSITGAASTTGNVTVGTGATGSFTTPTGLTVTVQDGIVTNIF